MVLATDSELQEEYVSIIDNGLEASRRLREDPNEENQRTYNTWVEACAQFEELHADFIARQPFRSPAPSFTEREGLRDMNDLIDGIAPNK